MCCHGGRRPHSKFCIAVSGFKVAGPLSTAVFSEGYATPTLHVLGRNDILVVEERSRVLINVSIGKRVEEHDGGTRQLDLLPAGTRFSPTPFSKAISFRPRQAGGHSLRRTCLIRWATFRAQAHTQRRSPGRVRPRHLQVEAMGAIDGRRHLAFVKKWRCASMLRKHMIEPEFMASQCDWGRIIMK